MKFAEILGQSVGAPASMEQVSSYIRRATVLSDSENARRARALRRHDLYVDDGARHMAQYIDDVFDDRQVRDKRKSWISKANFINVSRRVVHEISTLYRSPAVRKIASDSDQYDELNRVIGINQIMFKAQRLANLHRAVYVLPRMVSWSGEPVPRLDIIEPQNFFAISDPVEPKRLACLIFDVASAPIEITGKAGPRYRAITEGEMFYLDVDGRVIEESIEPNDLGFIPGALIALDPPSNGLIDTTTGEDIVAAHLSVWFENINLLKESKSATKQPVVQGDNTMMPRAQAADSEVAIEVPDGVMITTMDLSMDLSMFRDTADNIFERCAGNHGIPPAVLHHAGATSGYEIELRHIAIRERRTEQEEPFRQFERQIARSLSALCDMSGSRLAFKMDGWSINFGDMQAPQSQMEALDVFEKRRRLGLTDTVEEIKRMDPDSNDEQAIERIKQHILRETERNVAMRELQEIQGSMAASVDVEPLEPTDDEEGAQ